MIEKIYDVSENKRIVVSTDKVELQKNRGGYSYPSGAYLGRSWYTEFTFTKEEFENLKNLLTE